MSLDPDLRKALWETYELELQLNGQNNDLALESAVASVLENQRRRVVEEMAVLAETHANGLAEAAGYDDGDPAEAAGLRLFAHLLRKHESPVMDYEPEHLDLVAITIAGEVRPDPEEDGFWVLDDFTGDEFYFSSDPKFAPRVRVVSRAREELGA